MYVGCKLPMHNSIKNRSRSRATSASLHASTRSIITTTTTITTPYKQQMRRQQQQSFLHLAAVLCLLILIFIGEYSTTTALLNIVRPTYRHSNELAQFERYESLIGSTPFFNTFMGKWSHCVDLVSSNVKAQVGIIILYYRL